MRFCEVVTVILIFFIEKWYFISCSSIPKTEHVLGVKRSFDSSLILRSSSRSRSNSGSGSGSGSGSRSCSCSSSCSSSSSNLISCSSISMSISSSSNMNEMYHAPLSYYDLNPPQIFLAMHDSTLLKSLPQNFQDFIEIFKISYYAHAENFFMIGNCDLDLMSWGNSEKVSAISAQVHIDFILQGLSLNLHNDLDGTEIQELFVEYIDYALSRPTHITFKNYFDLLRVNLKNLNSVLFKTVIKYCPSNFPDYYFQKIYSELVTIALQKNLNLESKKSRNWVKMYFTLSKKFGVLVPYDKFKPDFFLNQNMNTLDIVVTLQPIIAAIARFDAVDFSNQFAFATNRSVVFTINKKKIYYWIDRFIKYDESFKTLGSSIPLHFNELADAIYTKLIFKSSSNLKDFVSECFSKQFFNLPEFIIMFSPLARNSLSNKKEQYNFLAQLCNFLEFDSDYKRQIVFLTAFPLTLAEVREHVVPLVINGDKNLIIQGLLFILEVVESAPADLKEIWRVPLHLPNIVIDFESPFLLDAGRLILARNFNILPSSTLSNSFFREESDYRDLGWFMSFYINLYRPNLGPDFKVKILDSSES